MRIRNGRLGQVAVYSAVASGGGGSTTTWNPADKNAAITLSGGNLIASSSFAGFVSLRAIASHSTGKFYYETTLNAAGNPNSVSLGDIANSAASLTIYIGKDTTGIAFFSASAYTNDATVATIQTYGVGDTVSSAVDLGAQLIWFRTNGGNWNNSGTANPATGVGGISISSLAGGPYFPAATLNTATDVITANFGATAYAQSVPAGFGNW